MLGKKRLEEEIKNCKITIEKLEDGLDINKIVLNAFEEELAIKK